MPQVPYSAVPQEAAQASPVGKISTAVSGDAFGTSVARSIEGLGKTTERAGEELFSRAYAMQQLENETEAKYADATYAIKAGEMHADYNSLQGKQAVDGYKPYSKALEEERIKIRNGLKSDNAKKAYDSQSLSVMSRTVFNGAGHAATENKRWAIGGAKAKVDSYKDEALSNPQDDIAFQRGINGIVGEVRAQGDLQGWGPEQVDNQISHEVSGAWSNRVVGLSRTNPFAAKEMLENNRDKIRGQDLEKVERTVRSQMHTVGARNISDAVNGGWAAYMPAKEIEKAVGVENALIRIVQKAQRDNPDLQFTIGGEGGKRTPQQQAAIVARGASQTYNSDHMSGQAIDLVPLKNGVPDYSDRSGKQQTLIADAMARASMDLGIPLAAKSKAFTNWDPAHFSLPKDYDVRTAPKPVEEPLQARQDRAKAEAKRLAPEDSMFADYAGDRTQTDFTRRKAIKADYDFTNRNLVEGGMVGLMSKGGKLPTSVDELKAISPEVSAAWDALDPPKQRTLLKEFTKNASGDVAWTQENMRRWQALKGMADTDPAEFMSVEVVSESMPNSAKQGLINLQLAKKRNTEADPRVTKSLAILQTDMFHAGITKAQNKEAFYQFTGALQDALTDFTSEKKRSPNAKEVQEIGTRLLQEQPDPTKMSFGIFNRTTRAFEMNVPKVEETKIKADPRWKDLGVEPTPEMIQRIYSRRLFQKLYGGTAKEAK